LDAIKSYATEGNTQVKVMENQIEKSQQELDNMVRGSRGKTLFVSFAKAPEIGILLGQLTRDVRIHQELYGLLMQQLEQAKILEAKDTPKVQYLERATPPYRKSWPKRSLIVLAGLFVGFFCSIVSVVVRKWWFDLISNQASLDNIRNLLSYFRA
jgi:tyrosine-protein kinase Etk/Wzc